ncbi:MAG: hypothetical protein J0I12_25345 [Candidatus Eremiobacteraeota bacterium]|nr:hypothetical protein [Candidatus Eremiobacteraeota bacterium]
MALGIWSQASGSVSFFYVDADELAMPGFARATTSLWVRPLKLPATGCRRWLGLAARADEPGGIHYLKDGVLLDPVEEAGRYEGTTAVVADAAVETDLSGLGVVLDEQVRQDQLWVREQEAVLLEECRAAVFDAREGERARLPMSVRNLWRSRLR